MDRRSMTSLLAYSVHLDLPPHRKHHQDPQFHGCALLSSSSPPPKKNNQKNHQGASMTTRQTIASPTPANIKISSPIPKKISHIQYKIACSLKTCSNRSN